MSKEDLDLDVNQDEENLDDVNTESTEGGEEGASADSNNTDDNKIPYNRFKQKVDEVNDLKQKLQAIEQEQNEQRQQELKEQNKYKELYEELQNELAETKKASVESKKKTILAKEGYSEEQIGKLLKLVDGDTDEEINKSVEELKTTFPTKTYVDPSMNNGQRKKPDKVDGEDIGRSAFDRLMKSGKLKGFKK